MTHHTNPGMFANLPRVQVETAEELREAIAAQTSGSPEELLATVQRLKSERAAMSRARDLLQADCERAAVRNVEAAELLREILPRCKAGEFASFVKVQVEAALRSLGGEG